MSECLVTKLKGVVNDDNLPILGNLRVRIVDSRYSKIYLQKIQGTSNPTMTVKGDIVVSYDVDHQNETWQQPAGVYPEYEAAITLTGTSNGYLDITLPGTSLIIRGSYVSYDKSFDVLASYSPYLITRILENGVHVPEDGKNKLSLWVNLMNTSNLHSYVDHINLSGSNIISDIDDVSVFGKFTTLTHFSILKNINPDTLASAMVSEGRISGVMSIYGLSAGNHYRITFDPSATGGYTKESI